MSNWRWEPTESREKCRLIISPRFHDYILIDADPDHPETIAIMNLICAAPEMLEALEEVVKLWGEGEWNKPIYKDALKAIAKAKGGQ